MSEPAIVPTLWAWVADDDGIVGAHMPGMGWLQFVFAEERNAQRVRDLVEDIAREGGKTVRLVRYEYSGQADVVQAGKKKAH